MAVKSDQRRSSPAAEIAPDEKGSLVHDQRTKRDLFLRIRTVSGHLSGIERMAQEDAYCTDILKQIVAVQSSLSKIAMTLSESHMRHYLRSAVAEDRVEAKLEELLEHLWKGGEIKWQNRSRTPSVG